MLVGCQPPEVALPGRQASSAYIGEARPGASTRAKRWNSARRKASRSACMGHICR